MIIESIKVQNFLSHTDSSVDFTDAPMWLVFGENGAGKSALFDAVEYALYGQHRGGGQGDALLVKQGAEAAIAQVVIVLDGNRYRITRHLHAQKGNLGGSIEEARGSAGTWERVPAGDGVRSAWDWLERRLPPHELFRSAIFLRQGQATYFLGSLKAADRMKRFADLIGLDRYTAVAVRAKERAVLARDRQQEAQGALNALNDVSDARLAALEAAREAATAAGTHTRAAQEAAKQTLEGATTWERLRGAAAELEGQRGAAERLLADGPAILAAHTRVTAWDHAAESLGRYWRARADAATQRTRAAGQEKLAGVAAAEGTTHGAALAEAQTRQTEIAAAQIPALRLRVEAERAQVPLLTLEAQIAHARATVATADAQVEARASADHALHEWRTRHAALPHLRALAEARSEDADAGDALSNTARTLQAAGALASTGEAALKRAGAARIEADTAASLATEAVQSLARAQATLQGRVAGHSSLAGGEPECPVCARPLDTDAHAHVGVVLAQERALLAGLGRQLVEAKQHETRTADARRAALSALEQATAADRRAHLALARAEGDAQAAAQRQMRARASVAAARASVTAPGAPYAGAVEQVTADWLQGEQRRVAAALKTAQDAAAELGAARENLGKANAALSAFRGQRAPGAVPHGEQEDASTLKRRAQDAKQEGEARAAQLTRLESEVTALATHINQLTGIVARLAQQARSAAAEAETAAHTALENDAEADCLVRDLGADWVAVLVNSEAYVAERRAVDGCRTTAARITELAQARGRLEQIEQDQRANAAEQETVSPAHRLPLADAQSAEREASDLGRVAEIARSDAVRAVQNLVRDRELAARLRTTLDVAAEESATHDLLSNLLRAGGPVQNAVAEQEQRTIADEVNNVLRRLKDGLEVQLGGARRARGAAIQDIQIMDTTDPSGRPRHFEFLSGGEQFRVALALALALHRRVGREAGTLIVDEGFGALDANRRDALAQQMTAQGEGILGLKLAESIIICSHSEEVQRHFPNRWHVRKQDGAARVTRAVASDDHEREIDGGATQSFAEASS